MKTCEPLLFHECKMGNSENFWYQFSGPRFVSARAHPSPEAMIVQLRKISNSRSGKRIFASGEWGEIGNTKSGFAENNVKSNLIKFNFEFEQICDQLLLAGCARWYYMVLSGPSAHQKSTVWIELIEMITQLG